MTVENAPDKATMILEGKLAGPWVGECRHFWGELLPALSAKKLFLDLCGLTFVDTSGMQLLREIYSTARPEFRTNSPLTLHFAEQVMQSTRDGRIGA